ncbi:MAG: zinc metalloprotease [Chryseobacterium sp.]|jgi:outer membrane murein-binding lipoprotein Lpp|uniref:M43 family zinc metalloprotease n=1 Tax=Chryseobacterium sp. TaxID=1871047 RepID=UPI002630A67B|nr:M43 family zinc metalloprotease [Chryseobacterium sp.]MDF2552513.1 zinc metalloprotease [Chryseobacterium sp.]
MKKTIFMLGIVSAILAGCESDEKMETLSDENQISNTNVRRGCASDEVLKDQIANNPELAKKIAQIESFTQSKMNDNFQSRLVNGVIEIPVVVNVLYRTAAENISQAQIQSQIDILNKDFNATNSDFNNVPTNFSNVKANVGIRFVLDQVVRKSTKKTSWGTKDAMKKSAQGGLNPISPTTKLNLWACTIGGGILGYAQFPGGASATDGVVIDSKYLGNTGTATYPFNLGRTATHEIGHWMNLRHIWGDATCGNDLVADTPSHNAANYGAPAFPHYSTCSGSPIEMTMNYMDYVDDRAMYMFSTDQKSRMLAIFQSGGPRYSFAQ